MNETRFDVRCTVPGCLGEPGTVLEQMRHRWRHEEKDEVERAVARFDEPLPASRFDPRQWPVVI